MRALDLFCGAGGASLGLVRAGLELVGAYDFDAAAVRAHAELVPACPVTLAAVESVEELPAADLWWASPPCTPYTSAGRRVGALDARDGFPALFAHLWRYPPAWLLVENVPALTHHFKRSGCEGGARPAPETCHGCYFARLVEALRDIYPHVEARILDAADYGTPQHRERAIVACGPRPLAWPAPSHGPAAGRPYVGAGAALSLAPRPGLALVAAGLRPDGRTCEGTARGLERPGPTILGRQTAQLVEELPEAPGRYRRLRTLTVPDSAALQGLPWAPALIARTVGNAVPPALAEALGRAVLAS